MLVKQVVKLGLVIVVSAMISGCGGGGGSGGNTAIDKIIAFVVENGSVPTAADYATAGVNGVTDDNVNEINTFITGLTKEDVDSKEELQAIADKFGISFSPRADIQVSKLFATEGTAIRFSAEKSDDPDGTIVAYEWKDGSNVLFTIPTFDISTLAVGVHIITLTVTDNDGNKGSTTAKVTIEKIIVPEPEPEPAPAPVVALKANAGPDQDVVIPQQVFARYITYNLGASNNITVTLDGSGSTDDGKPQPLTYLWKDESRARIRFSDETSVNPTFSLSCRDDRGNDFLEISLTVSDGASTDRDTVKINIDFTACRGN